MAFRRRKWRHGLESLFAPRMRAGQLLPSFFKWHLIFGDARISFMLVSGELRGERFEPDGAHADCDDPIRASKGGSQSAGGGQWLS